jgi:hypothetical protein
MAAQIRSELDAGKQSCADRFPTSPGQNHVAQTKCFNANQVAQSSLSVQTAETHTKQRIVNVRPLDTLERAPPPKPDGRHETVAVASGVPALHAEASCHLADNLAVDQNVNHCLSVESSARAQLALQWTEFPSADRSHCMRYSSAGGGGTYTDLLTCLEMELDARNLHVKNRSRSATNQ